MTYLEAAIILKKMVKKANLLLLEENMNDLHTKNKLLLRSNFGNEVDLEMDAFTNEFVTTTLKQYESEAFVITDFVSNQQKDQEIHYFLYKGYSKYFDKGLVYFQLVNKENLQPLGGLEFSNLEDNIFYLTEAPDYEESSCNAIETKENTAKKPSIAFLIGHMNEERLLFDIQRLIYDTANNVQKHKNRQFKFTLQIDKFGGQLSENFMHELNKIRTVLENNFAIEYPNTTFLFEIGH
ncbi:hypothetical protein [Saccharicrinis fermentans]|uniref:Uncharacterized protein n=1 Tax=Saccharicrinis fermentans DSM 9555 = JCM 21142 TaxID=869213 RepID=W7YLC9_9BACT|nr:hypothetical protein [Saccharicrinis fermentans]GAF05371.1 hypothetical protein JCM21142_104103 [Saccharicrinis fermentans DSM 9555 = JCM 21142]